MSDWTGINVDEVSRNLANFEAEANEIANQYKTAFQLFNSELCIYWASPRAVEFNAYILKMGDIYNYLLADTYDILYKASLAATDMASANGATFNSPYMDANLAQSKFLTDADALQDNHDGVEGMNINAAKTSLMTFASTAQAALERLDGISTNFGLYDPSGELQAAYKGVITARINNIIGVFNEASNVMSSAFGEEVNQIEGGFSGGIEELGGTANEAGNEGSDSDKAATTKLTLGSEISRRYSDDWSDFTTGVANKWAHTGGILPVVYAAVGTVAEAADMVIDGALDTVTTVTDSAIGGLNWVFDAWTGRTYEIPKVAITHTGEDFGENWQNMVNADNVGSAIGGFLEGTVRSAVDVVQVAANGVGVAIDAVGDFASDAVNWIGGLLFGN